MEEEGVEEALGVEAAVVGMTVIAADLTVAGFVAETAVGLLPLQLLWQLPEWTALPEVEKRPPDRPGVVGGFVGFAALSLVVRDPAGRTRRSQEMALWKHRNKFRMESVQVLLLDKSFMLEKLFFNLFKNI